MNKSRLLSMFLITALSASLLGFLMINTAAKAQNENAGPDRAAIESIIKDYLESNPQVVVNALENFRTQQADRERIQMEKTISSLQDELANSEDPFAGNPDGNPVIVEFFDYNCGYCKRAADVLANLLEQDDQIKVVFKEMPILSESSRLAARYSLASQEQGKYFEYHMALMNFGGPKTVENLEKVAEDVGLDVEKLRNDAASEEVSQKINESMELSQKLGVRGTPAFVVGDMFAPGYMDLSTMKDLISQARDNEG